MAEGHVVRYNAERFHALLAGKPLVRAAWRSRRIAIQPADAAGRSVREVAFAGKNHLFVLDDGGTFRVHLMMFGSTQAGPPHLALRKPETRVRFLLEVPGARVVAFSAPIVEYYAPGQPIPALAALEPDALKEAFDAAAFRARLRGAPHATVAEALLDPSVVAGVGNVYKSEALWRARVHPRRAPASLAVAEARAVAREVPAMMLEAYRALRNHQPMHGHRHVYRRSGQPCVRCGAAIRYEPLGGRRTFWCPGCRPEPPSGIGEPAEPAVSRAAPSSAARGDAGCPGAPARSGAARAPARGTRASRGRSGRGARRSRA